VEAIKSAVSRAGLKGSSCAIAVCGRELIIKKVQIPEVPAKEVGDVVQLEAEHHVPFAIDEVFLDYQSIGQHNGVLDLILVAVKKSKVLEYAAVVEEAGLSPTIVDVDSFALGNQFELNYPNDRGETVALIDIGASIMKTNVVRAGSTIFARDIPFGGNNYTQAIAQQLKIPFEQAEAAKLGRDVGVRWETVVPALEAVSRELSLEVQRTFDYFASTAESERIGKIVLAGGCAQLPGLSDYLSSNWGIPVELTKPFQRIQIDRRTRRKSTPPGPRWRWPSVSRCDVRGTNRNDQDQPRARPRPSARRRVQGIKLGLPAFNMGWLFGVVYLALLLGIGVYWWILNTTQANLTADIDRAQKDLTLLKQQIGQESKVRDLANELRKRVEVIEAITKAPGQKIQLVDAFASVMPNDLWVTGFEERSGQIKIIGSAFSPTAIADFMSNLRASGKFKDVDLVVTRRDLGRPSPLVTFEVTCRYES
jgi:type IV pilus assembly protein PilM